MNMAAFEAATGLYHLWVLTLFVTILFLLFVVVRMTCCHSRLRIRLIELGCDTDEAVQAAIERFHLRYFQSAFLALLSGVGATTVLTVALMSLAPKTSMVVGPILAILLLAILRIDSRLKQIKEEWRESSRIFCQARRAVNRRQ